MNESDVFGPNYLTEFVPTGDFPPAPLTFFGEPAVCACGYAGRHSRLRHWYRLRFLREAWH